MIRRPDKSMTPTKSCNFLFLLFAVIIISMGSASSISANHSARKNYIFWPINMKIEHQGYCIDPFNLGYSLRCRRVSNGDFSVQMIPINSELGLVQLLFKGVVEFVEVSNGEVFIFEQSTGGRAEGLISVRRTFCISAQSGNYGYSWDGVKYNIDQEATEACPIGQEAWPWLQ